MLKNKSKFHSVDSTTSNINLQIYSRPNMKTVSFSASDKQILHGDLYTPENSNGRGVVVNGATGVLRKFYKAYAEFLQAQGFTVFTYDYRGIGDSHEKHPESNIFSMMHWGEYDMDAAVDWFKAQHPELKILGMGHSIGGQLLGVMPDNNRYQGFLNIAAQQIYWKNWIKKDQPLSLFFFFVLLPIFYKVGAGLPRWVLGAEYLPREVIRDWSRFGRKPYYTNSQGQKIEQGFLNFTGKMRFYAMADDKRFAPPSCVKVLQSLFKNADTDMHIIHPSEVKMKAIDHFGFFKKSMNKGKWQETADWLLSV